MDPSSSGGGGLSNRGGAHHGLHLLCRRILGPNCGEEVVARHYRDGLHMLSSSTATRTKETLSAEFNTVEKIKKRMVRAPYFSLNFFNQFLFFIIEF